MFFLTNGGLDTDESKLETLSEEEAINLSIAKWGAIVAFTAERGEYIDDGGSTTCALCKFARVHRGRYSEPYTSICVHCPISMLTGMESCSGSPYSDYLGSCNSENAVELAMDELEFLFMAKEIRQIQRNDVTEFIREEARDRKEVITEQIAELESELGNL